LGSDSCGSEVMKSALGGGCTRTGALNSGMMTEVRICCGTYGKESAFLENIFDIFVFFLFFIFLFLLGS